MSFSPQRFSLANHRTPSSSRSSAGHRQAFNPGFINVVLFQSFWGGSAWTADFDITVTNFPPVGNLCYNFYWRPLGATVWQLSDSEVSTDDLLVPYRVSVQVPTQYPNFWIEVSAECLDSVGGILSEKTPPFGITNYNFAPP